MVSRPVKPRLFCVTMEANTSLSQVCRQSGGAHRLNATCALRSVRGKMREVENLVLP
jgi:hypothetical protein